MAYSVTSLGHGYLMLSGSLKHVVKCQYYKTVKATYLKFDVHVSRESMDMTP